MDNSSPPRPRPRPPPPQQSSSPLNPASNAHPIPLAGRRPSATGLPYARKPLAPNTPNTPTRFMPRTPLSFLSHSPSSTFSHASHQSSASSIGWQLRTPLTTTNSMTGFPAPSPMDLPPANLALLNKLKSNHRLSNSPLHIKIPSSMSTSSIGSTGSPSHGLHMPSPLDKLDHLQSIPASPPILVPCAQLLELAPNTRPDATTQHSIASPFVNLHSSPSPRSAQPGPVSSISPFLNARRRQLAARRGSTLARELDRLEIDVDDAGHDADTVDDADSRVPSPNPAGPTVSDA